MIVLVTGATGYLGGAIARMLLAEGHTIRALVRDRDRAAGLARAGMELVAGDVTRVDAWADALRGCEGVIHAAALVSAWGPARAAFEAINRDAPLRLLDAATAAGIERVVLVSSLFALAPSPDGTPRGEESLADPLVGAQEASEYARSKALGARAAAARQDDGSPAILVFPTVLLGPGERTDGNHIAKVLEDIRRRRLPGLIGNGRQRWNLVGVEDAARGVVRALTAGRPGGRYILAGEDWTQEELVRRAAAILGVAPPLRPLGTAVPSGVARLAETWAHLTGRPPLLTRGEVRLYGCHWTFRADRAREELSFDPEPIDELLFRTVTWLCQSD